MNKLLHGSLVTLKAEADSATGALYLEAARRFFNLVDNGRAAHMSVATESDPEDETSRLIAVPKDGSSERKR